MTPHLHDALAAWLSPKTRSKIQALLASGELVPRTPTSDEETALHASLDASHITSDQWDIVVAVSDRIRQANAERTLTEDAEAQVERARRFLDLTPRDFLRWPWKAMDDVVGGMAPGTVHGIVCPSKGGKTTLMRSAAKAWIQQSCRVFYGAFEMPATTMRTMYAADDCGLDPGDVLSGLWQTFGHYDELRPRMKAAYEEQLNPLSPYKRLRFSSFESVDERAVRGMMEQAHDWGADAVILDHIDHLSIGTGRSYEMSIGALDLLEKLTKRYALKCIFTSQTNYDGRSQDKFRDHRPVLDTSVKMGGKKKEICTTMLGFYRPLKLGFSKEEKAQVAWGEKSPYDFLWPDVNAFNLMAHRGYGRRVGQRDYLGWERGQIVEAPHAVRSEIESRKHGVTTGGY